MKYSQKFFRYAAIQNLGLAELRSLPSLPVLQTHRLYKTG